MDHWSILASGSAEDFTSTYPADYYGEPDTFQLELRTGDDRAIRITGDRSLLKHDRQHMASDQDIRHIGVEIAHSVSDMTGAEMSLHAVALGSDNIPGGEPPEAGTFWLELKTHDDRTIRIEGDRRLFEYGQPLMTDRDILQVGGQIASAINAVTGELEHGGTAQT
jgi:hypothetical protein